MDKLIALEPSNVVPIMIEPAQIKCSGKFTLRNVMCTMPVAFRLQPMTKLRYTIKPQSAIIAPLAALTVEIIYHLPPGSTLPDSIPYSDDPFLLHSVVVPGASMRDPKPMFDLVPNDWFTTRKKQLFIDSSIKVMFVGGPVLVKLVSDGSIDQVRQALEHSGSVYNLADSKDSQGQSLLHIAIARGRADMVELLLEFEPNLEIESRSASTPLQAAAAAGETSIVKLLLENKARTERTESYAWGPIHLAAGNGHLEVLKLLLINEADPNSMTKDGNTALHISVKDRRRDCARLLLASGADPNIRNALDGDTPLHIAAVLGDEKMVNCLLKRGASKNTQNEAGKIAYDVAAEFGHTRLFDALKLGDSLCVAAIKGDVRSIKKLIENGANIGGRDQHGWTALHRACFKGRAEAAKLLIQNGIDMDAKEDEGYTALHCAVESGHVETVELLVKKGADVNARTNKNVTCLQIAESLQYAGICRILVDGGAKKPDGGGLVFVPVKGGKMKEEAASFKVVKRRQPSLARAARGGIERSLPLQVV